jgi:Flp pilus assembly protein TadD
MSMDEDFSQDRIVAPAHFACAGARIRVRIQMVFAVFLSFAGILSAQPHTSMRSSAAVIEAQRLLQENKPSQAIEVLRRNGQTIDALKLHLLLGTAYALLPDTREAYREFDKAVRIAPREASVHRKYGLSLMRLGEVSGARRELLQANAIDPNDPDTHFNLALLDERDDQPEDAVVEIQKAMTLTQDRDRLRLYSTTAGQMEVLLRDWPAALKHFKQALVLDKTHEPSWSGLGFVLEEQGNSEEAADALKQATALKVEDVGAWQHLGEAESRLGDCTSAVDAYEHANSLQPRDRSTLSHLARSLTSCGREAEADAATLELKKLVQEEISLGQQGPELAQINAEAIVFEQHGDYAAAEGDYRKLTALDPTNPIFHRNLGLVLCRQSKWTEGIEELRHASALAPDDLDSQRALNLALSASHIQH